MICCSLFENQYNCLVLHFFPTAETGLREEDDAVFLTLCSQPVHLPPLKLIFCSFFFFLFFFLQHWLFYFSITAVCVCIGSAFCSTAGCMKPTFSTASGRVLHCLICFKTAQFSSPRTLETIPSLWLP